MGELKLPDDYYDDDDSPYSPDKLTARERAQAMGWGIIQGGRDDEEEDPTDDLEGSEQDGDDEVDQPTKTATEKANERFKRNDGDDDKKETAPGDTEKDTEKESEAETPFKFKGDSDKDKAKAEKKKSSNKKKLYAAGGVGLMIVILSVFLAFLSSMKLVHFGEVLEATAYSRSAGIMQERMTQNIFDASVVEGDGSAALRGRTLVDRFWFRNVDNELAQAGRDGRFSMNFKDGTLETTRIGNASVSLDGITKELGFGNSYSDLSGGILGKLSPKAMRVRYEFTNQLKNAVGEEFATEARYVRGRLFGTIADNVGFKFSGWRQWARDFLGKSPQEADIKNKNDEIDRVVPNEAIDTGIDGLNKVNQKMRDKLKAAVEKNGGDYELAKTRLATSIADDIEKGRAIQGVTEKVSTAVLLTTLACMVREAFSEKNINAIANQNEQQADLMTLDFQSKVDQVKEGKHVVAEAVAGMDNQLNTYPIVSVDANGNTIKAMAPGGESAPGYLYATNQSGQIGQNTVDTPRIRPQINETLASLIDTLTAPPLPIINQLGIPTSAISDEVCSFALSPEGAITIAVTDIVANAIAGFFTLGQATLAEEAGGLAATRIFMTQLAKTTFSTIRSALLTPVGLAKTAGTVAGFTAVSFGLNMIAGQSSGTTFTGGEQGANLVERHYVASNSIEGRRLRTLGGIKIPKEEASKQFKISMDNVRAKWDNKNFASRLAGKSNPFSFVGMMSASIPTSFASVIGNITNLFGSIGSLFSSALTPAFAFLGPAHASAATADYSPFYDNQQYGFTTAELDKLRNDPTYSVAYNDDHITADQIANFDKTIGKCFDGSVSQNDIDNNYDSKTNTSGVYSVCDADNLQSDLIFRYRVHLLDTGLATSFYGDGTTPGGTTATPPTPATTSPGGTGTSGSLAATGLNGALIPCTGLATPVPLLSGPKADWSKAPVFGNDSSGQPASDSGIIGNNSGGAPIKVYIREACDKTNIKTVVVVGSIHGSENGGQLVAWNLLYNAQLPTNVRIIAVPVLNGTGVTANTRKNSNGVDLNRNENFRWGQWSPSGVCSEWSPSCRFYHGSGPGSEPETQAIDAFLSSVGKTNLFVIYHDNLDYVAPVGTTPKSIGDEYARIAGMHGQGNNEVGNATNVTQHGSLDGWYNSTTGTPSILVELGNDQSVGIISNNVNAILQLLKDGVI